MTEKAHIHFKEDGKPYLIPELPQEPREPFVMDTDEDIHEAWQEYNREMKEAIDNALPVVNPELVIQNGSMKGYCLSKWVDGTKLYEWPGTWEDIYSGNNISSPFEHKAKLIAPQQPQSDAPNEGREETRMIGNTKGKRLAESAFKLVQEYKELRDQLSKERETNSELIKRIDTDWYVVSLRKDIEKEREMRKELENALTAIKGELKLVQGTWSAKQVLDMIDRNLKASELDKNQET